VEQAEKPVLENDTAFFRQVRYIAKIEDTAVPFPYSD
jgi:hypothetical protein